MSTITVIKVTDDRRLLSALFDEEFARCHAGQTYRALVPKDVSSDEFDRPSFPIGTFTLVEVGTVTVREMAETAGKYYIAYTGRIEKDGFFGHYVDLDADHAKNLVSVVAKRTQATLDLGDNVQWVHDFECIEFAPVVIDLRDPLRNIVQRSKAQRAARTGQSV
ncbi:MAG: hypothetical protein GY833_12740 [Aestuariibacter sp.]|nr:hypothetical protein [Aestuariibacter sp.]|tara:strand:+ start:128660 stop:129151 length:492 start_codon:yes stop_codon:yes gene_type:complete